MFGSRASLRFAARVATTITLHFAAQDVATAAEDAVRGRIHFERAITLDDVPRRSASVSVADFNSDGLLDIVLLNGRHWAEPNRIFFGEGGGAFAPAKKLSEVEDRSYTGAVADFDGDGDLDIAVSNDKPDASYILFNDGRGRFAVGGTFGQPEWSTRNVAVSDLDGDGSPDIVVANRSLAGPSPNHVCFNDGFGRFTRPCVVFSAESATTITPHDVDRDGLIDLIVPSRDGGQSHVYRSRSGTRIDFDPIPFGPPDASIRAALAADFDGDALVDIVAIHTGNSEGGDGTVDRGRRDQGTVIYHGLRGGGFADAVPITGSAQTPYALAIADLNGDGRVDILVGHVEEGSTVLINQGDRFEAIPLVDSEGTTYGFATADLDRDGSMDIVVAKTDARSRVLFGSPASGPSTSPAPPR